MKILPLGNGVFRVEDGTRSRLGYATGPRDARWVFLDGNTYLVDLSGASRGTTRRKQRAGPDDAALAAPMPATVVAINVEPGARVSKGDAMIVLEAMKMELPILAPRDATVRAVLCAPGELVQPGVALLELE